MQDKENTVITGKEKYAGDAPVLLCSVSDDIKAGMLIAALKDQGIPVMKKSRGVAQPLSIIMGFSYMDVEIYVPSRLIEKAGEITAVIMGEDKIADEEKS